MNRFDLHALNADIRSGAEDFIARCDRRYDRLVAETAEQIAGNLPNSPIILLAGPSGSGKTTTALRIRAALEAKGIDSHSISLDDYYRSPAEPGYPTAETGEPDLESPLGLDVPLLTQHLTDLAAGREIQVPHFNFKIHDRDPGGSRPLRLGSGEVVVFEGLHALNPMFTERHPHAFRIYVSTATDLYDGGELLLRHDLFRLLRRCVRDLFHRSAPALETLTLWHNVCRGEQRFITPYRPLADVQLNTALGYELPVLSRIAEPQFFELPDDAPEMDRILAIQRAADRVEPVDPSLIPKTSLLREEFML